MKDLLAGLKGLGRKQLAALGGAAVLLFAALGFFGFYNSTENMSLLYGDLNLTEAAEMVDDLAKEHITTKTSADGTRIYVPRNRVASARLMLAKAGLPSGGAVGYELFDKSATLTTTQFEQNINETRALEGELERSVRLLQGVRNVRVHLVLPHRDLFATQTSPSQASVVLDIGRAGRISADAVQAIQNLVAAAVPGLRPQNISIVDTRGDVLARPGEGDGPPGLASSMEKMQIAEEQRLAQAVEDMLAPTLGAGHVRARASVTMDTNEVHETEESYDPNQQVLRSQQTSSEKTSNTETNPNTSVGNNLPNADAGQNRTGSSTDRQDETDNYEIGKRVKVMSQTRPHVARINLAVMVDGTVTKDKDGHNVWKPLSDEQIKQITMLAETAIGYDKERGDKVNVVSMRFLPDMLGQPLDEESFLNRNTLIYVLEWVIPVILVLGAFFIALWAMRKRGGTSAAAGEAGEIGRDLAGRASPVESGASASTVSGHTASGSPAGSSGASGHGNVAGPQRSESRSGSGAENGVQIDGIEGAMPPSVLERVRYQIDDNTREAVAVIRSWLAEPDTVPADHKDDHLKNRHEAGADHG